MASRKPSPGSEVRLQRYLASCGLGSRRRCEELIEQGVVSVNGTAVTTQGVSVRPGHSIVRVRGRIVRPEQKVYLALHKPKDVLCTSTDPQGRRTCCDLVHGLSARVYTVGRLDRDSEGLILMTNDGDFAHALMHPSHGIEKVYRAWTDRALTKAEEARLIKGVLSDGETLRAVSLERLPQSKGRSCYEMILHEGRNRQVRRMFEAIDVKVTRLVRTRVGSIELEGLARGRWRYLEGRDLERLRKAAGKD